jgi:RNA polymerase sigma-70 factor (ECF subfamily)
MAKLAALMTQDAAFSPTRWSLIATLRTGSEPARRAALETLCTAYWYPLYAYARRAGHTRDNAADLTQGFFVHLLEKDVFTQADPARGKLRTYLLTAMQHFLRDDWRKQQRLKRGSGRALFSIDELQAEGRYANEPADTLTPEALYHRRWASTLLEHALDALQADYERQGKTELFRALQPFLDEARVSDAATVGAPFGLDANATRVAIHRLRRRYRERLLETVAASLDTDSAAEVEAEVRALFGALG